jgi:site-specific recombinase XerD
MRWPRHGRLDPCRLVSRGENLKVVSELLGHRSIKMTERYARLSPQAKQSVVARLDDEPAI